MTDAAPSPNKPDPKNETPEEADKRRREEITRRGAERTLEAIYRRFPHLKED